MANSSEAYFNKLLVATKTWVTSKRFSIYLYCVALATLIWFLMKFSGSFTSQLPIKVNYTVPSAEWYVVDEETILNVEVKGFGFSLMWHKISGVSEINVNLANFEIKGDKLDPFVVVTSDYLISKVGQLFSDDESIDGIYPNILKVDLSQAITKAIPIQSRIVVLAENGYKIKGGLDLHPSEITLSGPAFILSTIDHINTAVDTIRGVKEDQILTISLEIDSLEEWVEGDNDTQLKIDVDELTSGSIEVNVESSTDDPNTKIKVLPTKVLVYYQVGLEDYQLVNDNLFKAYVSLAKSGELPDKLKVNISDVPDFVEVTRIDPPYVEYLLSKKE